MIRADNMSTTWTGAVGACSIAAKDTGIGRKVAIKYLPAAHAWVRGSPT